jgi:hypothetical protein
VIYRRAWYTSGKLTVFQIIIEVIQGIFDQFSHCGSFAETTIQRGSIRSVRTTLFAPNSSQSIRKFGLYYRIDIARLTGIFQTESVVSCDARDLCTGLGRSVENLIHSYCSAIVCSFDGRSSSWLKLCRVVMILSAA